MSITIWWNCHFKDCEWNSMRISNDSIEYHFMFHSGIQEIPSFDWIFFCIELTKLLVHYFSSYVYLQSLKYLWQTFHPVWNSHENFCSDTFGICILQRVFRFSNWHPIAASFEWILLRKVSHGKWFTACALRESSGKISYIWSQWMLKYDYYKILNAEMDSSSHNYVSVQFERLCTKYGKIAKMRTANSTPVECVNRNGTQQTANSKHGTQKWTKTFFEKIWFTLEFL